MVLLEFIIYLKQKERWKMNNERTKNASRNLFFGIISRFISILFPFANRTILIYVLGIQYIGISSLFASILSVLSLAELGLGSSIVYHMYKPIAEGDFKTVSALLNFYKIIYRIIGAVVILAGLVLLPFLDHFISGAYPNDINLRVIYLITLLNSATSYFLFAYKSALLVAYQRSDVLSKIASVVTTVTYVLQIVLLITFKNYYIYLLVALCLTLVNNFLTAIVVNRMYPENKSKVELNPEIKKNIINKVKSLVLYKVGNVVLNSADNIVISAFLGLTTLAIYGNYYFVIFSLFGFLSIYYSSITAGLGNSIVIESVEKNYETFKTLLFIQMWVIGWCSTCLLCLYQPFIRIWLGEKNMLPFTIIICLVIYFYVWKIHDVVHIFKDAAGMWDKDRYRPLVSAISNILLSILFVRKFGLYGVILSTVVCELIFSTFWAAKVLFDYYFKITLFKYLRKIGIYSLINGVIIIITYYVCEFINISLIPGFILKLLTCLVIPNLLMIIIFYNTHEFRELKSKIINILRPQII